MRFERISTRCFRCRLRPATKTRSMIGMARAGGRAWSGPEGRASASGNRFPSDKREAFARRSCSKPKSLKSGVRRLLASQPIRQCRGTFLPTSSSDVPRLFRGSRAGRLSGFAR